MSENKYYIATASRVDAKQWNNKEITWTAFVKHCSKVTVTAETLAEYQKMSKADKSKAKDVGGFVGGYLKEGKRSRRNVEFRSLITLDLDNATTTCWDDFTLSYNYTCLCYSTHSYTQQEPRLRFVFPTSRRMTAEEYTAVARYVAKLLGIEQMDRTTYDVERLFFWASMPKDVPFYFKAQEGTIIDVDEILNTEYRNWRDVSEWPRAKAEIQIALPSNQPPQDPLTKEGSIGVFCRCYTIWDVLEEFLSDVYVSSTKSRYTLINCGSCNGLQISSDGKFAYSHHASDPAHIGHWLNAFDLVRIHKFGELDDLTKDYEDPSTRPSFKRMCEFVEADENVKLIQLEERKKAIEQDFPTGLEDDANTTNTDTAKAKSWEAKLEKKGKAIASSPYNIMLILENHEWFKGKLYFNEFTEEIGVRGGLQWNKETKVWKSIDSTKLRNFLSKYYDIKGKEVIKDALEDVAQTHRIHPIKSYLNSLKWDGTPRLDTVLTDYLGAENTELNRAMIHKHLVAAVKRILQPGCKYDYCLILAGPEGIGKSTLLRILAGDEWFSDSVTTMDGREGMEAVTGCWLIEMPELVSQKRSTVESVKAFITKTEDKYRAAYAERKDPRPRQCVFCGTTNEDKFLKGDTGNRRFWIVQTPGLDTPFNETSKILRANRDQIWAEAVHYYRQGEELFLPSELEAQARKRQEKYNEMDDDDLISSIDLFLSIKLPAKWKELTKKQRREFYAEAGVEVPNGNISFTPVGTEVRMTMCAREFIEEYLDPTYKNTKDKYLAGEVNRVMRRKSDWIEEGSRFIDSQYGKQKRFRRKINFDKAAKDDDDEL